MVRTRCEVFVSEGKWKEDSGEVEGANESRDDVGSGVTPVTALETQPDLVADLRPSEFDVTTDEDDEITGPSEHDLETAKRAAGVGTALGTKEESITSSVPHVRELARLEEAIAIDPTNIAALQALARRYEAAEAWAPLVSVMWMRVECLKDRRTRSDLIERIAELSETRLGDSAAALAAHELNLRENPSSHTLKEVARLAESLERWDLVTSCRTEIARHEASSESRARQYCGLADTLSAHDRDSAKAHYEAALRENPNHIEAWDGLVRLAERANDRHATSTALLERAARTDGPRAAEDFARAARLFESLGDAKSAHAAWKAAHQSDPDHEDAASFLLDRFVRDKNWSEAAILAEHLVDLALRTNDVEKVGLRRQLAAMVYAGLGDTGRALTQAIHAFESNPRDVELALGMLRTAHAEKHRPRSLEAAAAALTALTADLFLLPFEAVVMLGEILSALDRIADAARVFEHAAQVDPGNSAVLLELTALYRRAQQWEDAARTKRALIDLTADDDARFVGLVELGELLHGEAGDLRNAAIAYEEAWAIRPEDPWILQTLAWIYSELADPPHLASVLHALTELAESPELRAEAAETLAELYQDELGDPERAATFFEMALGLDSTRTGAFEKWVRLLKAKDDTEGLESAMLHMIERADARGDEWLLFALYKDLGAHYRDRKADVVKAIDAFDRASTLRPENEEARRALVDLFVVEGELDKAVARVRAGLADRPLNPDLYGELYHLYLRQRAHDRAWCVVDVLRSLRRLTPEQSKFRGDFPSVPLNQIGGRLTEQAWSSHLLYEDLDPLLTRIFSIVAKRIAPLGSDLRDTLSQPRTLIPFSRAYSHLDKEIASSFADAAEILGVAPPALWVGPGSEPRPFWPSIGEVGSVFVNSAAAESLTDLLVYFASTQVAALRPELSAHTYFQTTRSLGSLLATAVQISDDLSGVAKSAAGLTDAECAELRALTDRANELGKVLDVRVWKRGAALSEMRAGFLLTQDASIVTRAIQHDIATTVDLTVEERTRELYRFAISDRYFELRHAIGIAIRPVT